MVRINRVYTKTGDTGDTSIGDGSRRAKDSSLICAIGDVDETNCALGMVRSALSASSNEAERHLQAVIARVQNDLFDLGADLCRPRDGEKNAGKLRVQERHITLLEAEIDRLNDELEPLRSFILPGGSAVAARLHHARAVARRAERAVVLALREGGELAGDEKLPAVYMNRLSDFLFVAARYANDRGRDDVLWKPGETLA